MRKFCANFYPPREGGEAAAPTTGAGGGAVLRKGSAPPRDFPNPVLRPPARLSVLLFSPSSSLHLSCASHLHPATPSPWRSSPSAHPDVPEGPSKPTLQTPDGVTPTPASSALSKPCFLVKKKN